MGGFTAITLKSKESITKHNKLLDDFGVRKSIRFATAEDNRKEYEFFRECQDNNTVNEYYGWSSHVNHTICTYDEFVQFVWNSSKFGFINDIGQLSFDCYFGRTSKRAMRNLGRYIAKHHDAIAKVTGSFETFIDRGMTKKERQIIKREILR